MSLPAGLFCTVTELLWVLVADVPSWENNSFDVTSRFLNSDGDGLHYLCNGIEAFVTIIICTVTEHVSLTVQTIIPLLCSKNNVSWVDQLFKEAESTSGTSLYGDQACCGRLVHQK